MRILLAEDELDLNRILTKRLAEEGYSVDACHDGASALEYLCAADYDAAILDVMMPKLDGFTVLAEMQRRGRQTPVLFLTARDAVDDRVRGLDLGADDYLVKPFKMQELLARIRSLVRRAYRQAAPLLTADDLTLDPAAHTVTRGGMPIELTAKEFALLEYLLRNRNRVLSRTQIEDHIWNFDYEGGTNVVDVYISYLRRKIDDGHARKLIHTIRGKGYSLKSEEPAYEDA